MTTVTLQNRYEIHRSLGQGGMGTVYLARDLTFQQRYVALKQNGDRTPAARAQFLLEAEMLAQLRHSNLPAVTDYFVLPDGRQFLVMDYIPGETLEERVLRAGPVPEKTLLVWAEQLLDALCYLHGQCPPVIHRDIKPANIRLTPEGRAVLVDFGVAKMLTGQATATVARAGSPGFAPVEQYAGGTDARSDIYALGATLYLALTGQPPLEAPLRAAGQALTPPRRINPAISPRTETAIMRALAVEASRRFQDAPAMRAALGLGGHAGAAAKSPLLGGLFADWRGMRWGQQLALKALAALVILTVMLSCGIIGWNLANNGNNRAVQGSTPTVAALQTLPLDAGPSNGTPRPPTSTFSPSATAPAPETPEDATPLPEATLTEAEIQNGTPRPPTSTPRPTATPTPTPTPRGWRPTTTTPPQTGGELPTETYTPTSEPPPPPTQEPTTPPTQEPTPNPTAPPP